MAEDFNAEPPKQKGMNMILSNVGADSSNQWCRGPVCLKIRKEAASNIERRQSEGADLASLLK